jgi:hypothetical protein
VQSHKDKEVADRDTVGHRGTRIGQVEAVQRTGHGARLRFRTGRDLEVHDGLQVDLPVLGKPFGFARAGQARSNEFGEGLSHIQWPPLLAATLTPQLANQI